MRDFSPETRGNSFSSTQSAPWTPPAAGSEDLSYQTSAERNMPVDLPAVAPESTPPIMVTPVPTVAPAPAPTPTPMSRAEARSQRSAEPETQQPPVEEQTLTRRQLREQYAAALAQAEETIGTAAPQPPVEEPHTPSQQQYGQTRPPLVEPNRVDQQPPSSSSEGNTEISVAMTEFDRMFASRSGVQTSPQPPSPQRTGPQRTGPQQTGPQQISVPQSSIPQLAVPVMATTPPPALQVSPGPAVPIREVVTAPEIYSAPVGHWSNQQSIDEESNVWTSPHRRNLASVDAITTSALVLPTFPQSGPITGPVSPTGQILVTGTIDLPRSLGISGFNPSRYESSDIDSIIDAGDREDSAPNSAPVRAVRAVSSYTSTQGIINAKRPKGSTLPMVLSITAGVMMVGVVVLVVAGIIFKIF